MTIPAPPLSPVTAAVRRIVSLPLPVAWMDAEKVILPLNTHLVELVSLMEPPSAFWNCVVPLPPPAQEKATVCPPPLIMPTVTLLLPSV